MSKYHTIRTALYDNHAVVIARESTQAHFPRREHGWTERVNFLVAPKVALYDADDLEKLMHQLVPGLEPTIFESFQIKQKRLEFGRLYFDEVIGYEKRVQEHTMTDPDYTNEKAPAILKSPGSIGFLKEEIALEHQRRTMVWLFPCEQLARAIADGTSGSTMFIPLAVLQQYAQSPRTMGL